MRKMILLIMIFELFFSQGYCQDNLLAVDIPAQKEKSVKQEEKKVMPKEDNKEKTEAVLEETAQEDDTDKDLDKIKAYRLFMEKRQKELEAIRFELEKSGLVLKKKENEKKIYDIEKDLPESTKAGLSQNANLSSIKDPAFEAADIKILLLLINGTKKEGIITLKGTPYTFQEGETIASKLTVERITQSGITFKQPDGESLKVNFIN